MLAIPVYIPTNSAQRLPFFHILTTLVISYPFDYSHSNGCEEIFRLFVYCDFDLHFSDD